MINKEKIIAMAEEIGVLKNINLVRVFGISRQYAARFLAELVAEGKMLKIGATRNAAYILPAYADRHPEIISNRYVKIFTNQSLEEHKVLDDIERSFAPLKKIAENVKSIFTYAFSEMMNNAIEHSGSDKIKVTVALNGPVLSFVVDDFGIGVFRNIMRQRQLNSELEAIQDLLK
ncbi:MAG: hypothetical protein NTY66_03210, partial [Candidatus Vogelbacteria bacterium]|nr:hypothetical protein [Candidatus Vogelbacteria bacterium]